MSLDVFRSAVAALSDPHQLKQAEEWLSQFERTREAWDVASQLLHENAGADDPHSFSFHAAKTIYMKVIKDFDQLQQSDIAGFTESLVRHIIALAPRSSVDMKATRYICLAIAALTIQLDQKGVIKAVLAWLNPILSTAPNVILEFLSLLPEEGKNRRILVSDQTIESFEHQLTDSFVDVFTFLQSLWAHSEHKNKVKILKCMEKWVQFTHIRVQDLVGHPLFSVALDCLAGQDLFEDAVAVISRAFVSFKFDAAGNPNPDLATLVGATVSRLGPLRTVWGQLNTDADIKDSNNLHDLCYSISEVYSVLGEATLPMMMAPGAPDFGQMEIVAQLLECSRFPHDTKVSQFPLTFFFQLGRELLKGSPNEAPTPHAAYLLQTYSSAFGTLIDIAIDQCKLDDDLFVPTGSDDVIEGSLEISDTELEIREEWRETIIDCRSVLGAVPCINHVCGTLQAAIQTASSSGSAKHWPAVESRLFVLKLLVPEVPLNEGQVMPWLCDAIIRLPDLFGLKSTIIELTGSCARWMSQNPAMLPHFLSLLSVTLQNQLFTIASATAISNIFHKCSGVPNLPVSDFNNLVVAMRQRKLLTLAADNTILDGLCAIVSAQAPELVGGSLQVVAGGLIEDLQELLMSSADAHVKTHDPKSFGNAVDRLTTIFKFLEIPAPNYSGIFERVYPLLQQVLLLFPTNQNISEKVCRLYKYVMRWLKTDFSPFLPAMSVHLCSEFARTKHEAFVYAASVLLQHLGRTTDAHSNSLLTSIVQSVTSTFFGHLTSLKAFNDAPWVVEEFFFFLAKSAKETPVVLLQAQLEAGVYNAAMVGLQIENREAHRGVLKFFENFIENINVPDDGQGATKNSVTEEVSLVYQQMLEVFGANLVAALLLCLSGDLPSTTVVGTRSITILLLRIRTICASKYSPTRFQEWFIGGLCALPATAQTIAQDMSLQSFVSAETHICHTVLEKFFKKCIRNK